MPTQSIQFPASQNPVQTRVQADPQAASAVQGAPGAVLGGPGVRVSVAGSSLDKLVAKVRGESEDARLASAKRRIAIVLTVLSALNVKVTESQKSNLAQIEALQSQLDELAELLSGKDGELSADAAKVAALEAQIEALKNAVKNAIKDGEAHRKQVEELKKTRSADDAELRAAQDALAKAEAAETAWGCGVALFATAHCAGVRDLRRKPLYRQLLREGVFDLAAVINGTGAERRWTLYKREELL